MKLILILLVGMLSLSTYAQKKVYKYKKYEKFDFETMDVNGSKASPGDLSIVNRHKKRFRNRIPERKNFNKEMRRALDSIR